MATQRVFALTSKAPQPLKDKFRGQQLLIVNFLNDNPNSTISEIAAGIKDGLQTRQEPSRVVSFYMSTMKKKGWVLEGAGEREAVAGEATTPGDVAADEDEDPEDLENDDEEEEEGAEVNPNDAASTGASVEERMEAAAEADLLAHSIRSQEKEKLSDVVVRVLGAGPMAVDDLVTVVNAAGHPVEKRAVFGAVNNLIRRGVVRKNDSSEYEVRA